MSNRPLPSSFDGDAGFYEESRWAKFARRLKEEPLIPLGCALTCVALYRASRSIRRGDKETTNKMFRARIYAQAFTVAAMVAGSFYWKKDRDERKVKEMENAQVKAKEKQQAWIKELEIRDQEDRELRERARKLVERRRRVAEGSLIAEQAQRQSQEAAK